MTAFAHPIPAAEPSKPRRQDLIALWAGVAFSLVFVAIIWLAGERLNSVAPGCRSSRRSFASPANTTLASPAFSGKMASCVTLQRSF